MTGVIGELLPLAVGVAISPVPIIAVILMLVSAHARAASLGFLAGWIVGIAVVVTIVVLLTGSADVGSGEQPSTVVSWAKIVIGVALLGLAGRHWRHRTRAASRPAWMGTVDAMTAVKATGLGLAVSAVNPKNLALGVAAGIAIAQGHVTTGQKIITVAGFTLVAASTVLVPVVGYLLAAERVRPSLDRLRAWLEAHNSAVMSVLLVVIGAVLLGRGISGL